MIHKSEEFWASLGIIGAISALGILISIALLMIGIGIYRKKKSETKLTFNGKERSNGHEKTITRRKW